MKMVAPPVSGWNGVDSPPTSHLSHVATRGSSPMAACSAAWAVPGSAAAVIRAWSNRRRGRIHQSALVTRVCGGRSSITSSRTSWVEESFRWNPTTWRVTFTSPNNAGTSLIDPWSTMRRTSTSVMSRVCV
jgi:hypothetical protein